MSTKIGKLHASSTNSAGKKIDEWIYKSPFGSSHRCVVKVFGDRDGMTFKAYPMKEGASAQGQPFMSSTEIFSPISETDINRLRDKVEEAYRLYDGVANGAVWENWLEVKIRRSNDLYEQFIGLAMTIGYRHIKKAVLPDGKEVTINGNNRVSPFPKPKSQGVDEGKPEDLGFRLGSGREIDSEYAYLPATEENIKTLESMQAGLKELHARVSAFVRASAPTGKLDATSFKALPAPSSEAGE